MEISTITPKFDSLEVSVSIYGAKTTNLHAQAGYSTSDREMPYKGQYGTWFALTTIFVFKRTPCEQK